MKRQTGIWIDSSKAIIICIDGKRESITEIDSDIENKSHLHREGNKGTFSGNHHGTSKTQFENRIDEQTKHYMDAVVDYVKKSDELYIFGPSGAKNQLKKRILEDHLIAPEKLKAVATSSKMTANQIVANVKEFYNL
jgi:stalled ribosome rescue protein Dom34